MFVSLWHFHLSREKWQLIAKSCWRISWSLVTKSENGRWNAMSIIARQGTIIYKGILWASYYRPGKRSWSDYRESSANASSVFIHVSESLGDVKMKWRKGHKTGSCSSIIHRLPAPRVRVQFWPLCQKGRNRFENIQRKATRVTETCDSLHIRQSRLYPFSLGQIYVSIYCRSINARMAWQ